MALMDVIPEDEVRIESETLRVFGELRANAADAFYQRTRQRLERLAARFAEWNAGGQHAAALLSIKAGVGAICASIEEGKASRATCETFLERAYPANN